MKMESPAAVGYAGMCVLAGMGHASLSLRAGMQDRQVDSGKGWLTSQGFVQSMEKGPPKVPLCHCVVLGSDSLSLDFHLVGECQ